MTITRKGIIPGCVLVGTFFALLVGATFTESDPEDEIPLRFHGIGYLLAEGGKRRTRPASGPQIKQTPTLYTQELNWWTKPSVTSVIKFYFYNFTNSDDFLNNGSKPTVDEIGPYVYNEKWEQKDISINENGTVSYYMKKVYHFNEELSSGKEEDLVIVPNIPMLSATSQSKYAKEYLRTAMSSIINILKLTPFVELSIKQLLWGYADPLLELAKEVVSKEQKLPYDQFGLMYNKNGTLNDRVTVFTKYNDITKHGLIDTLNGKTHLNHWLTGKCNSLSAASDGFYFPPDVQTNTTLYLYENDLCRTLPLVFEQEGKRKDNVTSWRFSPPKNVFDNAEENLENHCYCPDGVPCAPSGLFNVSLCQYDSPMMISFPHFYLADDTLRDAVDGISPPDPEKHKFYVDVQPDFGFAMSTKRRLQFNLAVTHVDGIQKVATFPDIILPVMWFEEAVEINPEVIPEVMKNLPKNETQAFKWWAKPPVVPLTKFYIYNVTNVNEFLDNGSKPVVDEVGPYVYQEKWERKYITFNQNGTVSYSLEKFYYFDKNLSAGVETDLVVVPNIPLLSTTSQYKHGTKSLQHAIASITDFLRSEPFVEVSVGLLLWGYKDSLLSEGYYDLPVKPKYPFAEFGLLYNKNGTPTDRVSVFTGSKDKTKYGLIDTINGMTHQTHCQASDGFFFPPHVTKDTILHLYDNDLCRTLPLAFEEVVSRKDNITSWRFSPLKNGFDSVEMNPENQCYCPGGPSCATSGLFNVTLCRYDWPVMLSFPHFYLADDAVRNAVVGISPPDPEKHKFYVDVQPDLGFALSARRRLQINLDVSHVGDIKQVAKFPEIIFPIMWFEEAVELKPEEISKLMA